LTLFSCGAYYNQPTGVEKAIIGENTKATTALKQLPKAKEQIVVGLYKFRIKPVNTKLQKTAAILVLLLLKVLLQF
jgi:curli production assembly/transport component CsgG